MKAKKAQSSTYNAGLKKTKRTDFYIVIYLLITALQVLVVIYFFFFSLANTASLRPNLLIMRNHMVPDVAHYTTPVNYSPAIANTSTILKQMKKNQNSLSKKYAVFKYE